MKERFIFSSDEYHFQKSGGSKKEYSRNSISQKNISRKNISERKSSSFVGVRIFVLLFVFVFCFLTIAGCLSDINPIVVNPSGKGKRVFPEALQNFPASRFEGKFWAGLVSGKPVTTQVAINCYFFTDIGANSMTWASSIFNPRHRTTASSGGTYQPANPAGNNAGVHFETSTVGGVEMISSNFFIAYVDVPAGNTYFDSIGNWGVTSAFTFPRKDFERLGTFADTTIAQLVVIEGYEEGSGGQAKMGFNFPPGFYAQKFAAGTTTADKINDLKTNLIERNTSFIASGSLFESLWKEHFTVTDKTLADAWQMQSSGITDSVQTLDCGRDYTETGQLIP